MLKHPSTVAAKVAASVVGGGAERVVRGLLSRAGVEVGGRRPHDLVVHDPAFDPRVLAGGELPWATPA